MEAFLLSLWILAVFSSTSEEHNSDAQKPHLEIVHRHSLYPPFISEWWQGALPNWDFGGSTVVTEKFIRLTPDKQSRIGWLWNEHPNFLPFWEATLLFRIHGSGAVGADGFALWLVDAPYPKVAPNRDPNTHIWGNRPDFKGIGIIFDTYDNDGQRDNPIVSVVVGSGQTHWDTEADLRSSAKLRCKYNFRTNEKFDNTRLRLIYSADTLQLFLSAGVASAEETFCGKVDDLPLPMGYFFGLTSTTGHLADNHDVFAFVVTAAPESVAIEDKMLHPPPVASEKSFEASPTSSTPSEPRNQPS